MLPLLLLLALAPLRASAHGRLRRCVHDTLLASLADAARAGRRAGISAGAQAYRQQASGGGSSDSPRSLQLSGWAPLRVLPVYIGGFGSDSAFGSGVTAWVRGVVMPAAVAALANMLSVQPVVGPLLAHRTCTGYWQTATRAWCGAYESLTSVSVDAMTAEPVDFTLVLNASYLAADTLGFQNGSTVVLPAGGIGFPNADVVLFVTGISTSLCAGADSDTLAYATPWQTDQYDRPVFGQINLCPGEFTNFYAAAQAAGGSPLDATNIVMHEIVHVLGFSSSLWPLFRWKDAARSPQTPRDALFPFQPASQYLVPLVKSASSAGCTSAWEPSIATLAWVTERGMSCSASTPADQGACVVRFVTPAAAAAAAVFFSCPGIPGFELENWDTSPCQAAGSHWEMRVGSADMMTPFWTGASQGFTLATLSVLDDSGWYAANFSAAAPSFYTSTFGYKQGCTLARDAKCITGGGKAAAGTPPHYALVDTPDRFLCRLDMRGYAGASLGSWGASLPSQYSYFSDPTLGGAIYEADFCPLGLPAQNSAKSNGFLVCSDASIALSSDAHQGMLYGGGTACLTSSLFDATLSAPAHPVGCYGFACTSATTATVTVAKPPGAGGGTLAALCSGAGGTALSFAGYSGTVTCPNVAAICLSAAAAVAADVAALNLPAVRAKQAVPVSVPSWSPTSQGGAAALQLSWVGIIVIAAVVCGVLAAFAILIAYCCLKHAKARRIQEELRGEASLELAAASGLAEGESGGGGGLSASDAIRSDHVPVASYGVYGSGVVAVRPGIPVREGAPPGLASSPRGGGGSRRGSAASTRGTSV